MIRIYIAGPYTKGDVAVNVRNAIEAGDALISLGFAPFVPHLSHFQHLVFPRPYEDWLALDFTWIETCRGLLRLPGESPGAEREVAHARALGLPVFFEIDEITARFPGKA